MYLSEERVFRQDAGIDSPLVAVDSVDGDWRLLWEVFLFKTQSILFPNPMTINQVFWF